MKTVLTLLTCATLLEVAGASPKAMLRLDPAGSGNLIRAFPDQPRHYRIESSKDLVNWFELEEITLTEGEAEVPLGVPVSDEVGYFRVWEQPLAKILMPSPVIRPNALGGFYILPAAVNDLSRIIAIERRVSDSRFGAIASGLVVGEEFLDHDVDPSTIYAYRVIAELGNGAIAASEVTQATTRSLPPRPSGFSVNQTGPSDYEFRWDCVQPAETLGWILEFSTDGVEFETAVEVDAFDCEHIEVDPPSSGRVHYRLRFSNEAGISVPTEAAQFDVEEKVPAPYAIHAEALSGMTARVGWRDGNSSVDHYEIWEKRRDQFSYHFGENVPADRESAIRTGLTRGEEYCFQVRVVLTDGKRSDLSLGEHCVSLNLPDSAAPNNIHVEATGQTSARVSWRNNAGALSKGDKFEIWQKRNDHPTYTFGESVPYNRLDAERTGLTANHTYCFKVLAEKNGRRSQLSSDQDCATLILPPLTSPDNIRAETTGPGSARIFWRNNSGALSTGDKFEIWQKRDDQSSYVFGENVPYNRLDAERTGLSANHTYCFKVRVEKEGRRSELSSAEDCVFVGVRPPSGVSADGISRGAIRISWRNNAGTVERFEIWQRRSDRTSFTFGENVPPDRTNATRDGLLGGTTYCFKVIAVKSGVTSQLSNDEGCAQAPR